MKSRNSFAFPGKDVKIFINWYKNYIKNLKVEKEQKILCLLNTKIF